MSERTLTEAELVAMFREMRQEHPELTDEEYLEAWLLGIEDAFRRELSFGSRRDESTRR